MRLLKLFFVTSLMAGNLQAMTIEKSVFGRTSDGQEVTCFDLMNGKGLEVKLINYGARIVELDTLDSSGKSANITLGLKTVLEYEKHDAHFGGTVGRYANRIANGAFELNGKKYMLAKNNPPNHLHGGIKGFDSRVWQAKEFSSGRKVGVVFSLESQDLDEGYPGDLHTQVTFTLEDSELRIDYEAKTDKPTVINLTNHAYWNLSGAGNGNVMGTQLRLFADHFLPIDKTSIPIGKELPVADTPMDFTHAHPIGDRIAELQKDPQGTKGYDHCYVLKKGKTSKLELAARAKDPKSGRVLEVYTTEPGLQFYTANFLDGGAINGGFAQYSAFCLESQHYPDSPNQPQFPTTTLLPGKKFHSTTIYRFFTEK